MNTIKHLVRGGNSGFVKNGVTFASDAGSCLRRALLRDHKIEETVSEKSRKVFAIGAYNEDFFEKILKADGVSYSKEKEFAEKVTEDSSFFGHSDYVCEDTDGFIVYELKSVTSKNTYKKIFEKNEPKLSNLAQCVNYMVSQETNRGRLVYSSYIEAIEYSQFDLYNIQDIMDQVRDIVPENKIFEILIDEDGRVLVDSVDSGYSVQDVLEHRKQTAYVLDNQKVFTDRPQGIEKFGSPCHFCAFRSVCDSWDNSKSTEEFLKACSVVVTKKEEPVNE